MYTSQERRKPNFTNQIKIKDIPFTKKQQRTLFSR